MHIYNLCNLRYMSITYIILMILISSLKVHVLIESCWVFCCYCFVIPCIVLCFITRAVNMMARYKEEVCFIKCLLSGSIYMYMYVL